jgi:hypothetical protein
MRPRDVGAALMALDHPRHQIQRKVGGIPVAADHTAVASGIMLTLCNR